MASNEAGSVGILELDALTSLGRARQRQVSNMYKHLFIYAMLFIC